MASVPYSRLREETLLTLAMLVSAEVSTIHLVDTIIHDLRVHKGHLVVGASTLSRRFKLGQTRRLRLLIHVLTNFASNQDCITSHKISGEGAGFRKRPVSLRTTRAGFLTFPWLNFRI